MKLLKANKSTVHHDMNRCKELGTCEDYPRSKKSSTAQLKKVIKAVREKVRRNPKKSTRQMANNINVSVASIRTTLKYDLQVSMYKIRKSTSSMNQSSF